MISAETLLICLNLALMGTIIFYLTSGNMQQKLQGKYELAFINRHRNTINELGEDDFLPLKFPKQETEHLLSLCQQYKNSCMKRFSNAYEPKVEIHYLAFRRLVPSQLPVRIAVIRCDQSHAIIEAGDGISGYLLEQYEAYMGKMSLGRTYFTIDARFDYDLGVLAEGAESSNRDGQALDPEPILELLRQTGSYTPAATTDESAHVRRRYQATKGATGDEQSSDDVASQETSSTTDQATHVDKRDR